MNNKTKSMVIGAAVGLIAGYLVGNLIVTRMNALSISEEYELEGGERSDDDDDDGLSEMEGDSKLVLDLLEKVKEREMSKYQDYTKMYKGDTKPPLADLASKYKPTDETNFKILTQQEYEEILVDDGADKSIVTYYEQDSIFADENDNILRDSEVEDLLGKNVLISFGNASNDPDIAYIKNTKTGISYEVTRLKAAYYGTVVDIEEMPVVPIRRGTRTNWIE